MILSDTAILDAMGHGLKILPWNNANLQPASVDLTLAPEILIRGRIPETLPYQLWPGQTALASTAERVEVPPTLAGRLEGKSTWARRFLFVHAAGFVDPGFSGQLTLEIVYLGQRPLTLESGMPICQIAFFRLAGVVARPYGMAGNHYQSQSGPTPAWSAQSSERL